MNIDGGVSRSVLNDGARQGIILQQNSFFICLLFLPIFAKYSPGTRERLRVKRPLYVGGVPRGVGEAALGLWHLRNATSMRGCLLSLYINQKQLGKELYTSIFLSYILSCQTSSRLGRGGGASSPGVTSATSAAPAATTPGRGSSGSGRAGGSARSAGGRGGTRRRGAAGATGVGRRARGAASPRGGRSTGAGAGGASRAATARGRPPAGRRKQGNMSRRTDAGQYNCQAHVQI